MEVAPRGKFLLGKHVKTWVWMPRSWMKTDLVVCVCNLSERGEKKEAHSYSDLQSSEQGWSCFKAGKKNQDHLTMWHTCLQCHTHTHVFYIHIQIDIVSWSLVWDSLSHMLLFYRKPYLSSFWSHFCLKSIITPKKVGYIFRFGILIKMIGKKLVKFLQAVWYIILKLLII